MSVASTSSFTTASFSGSNPADTSGWDIVYALKANIVNASLTEYFAKQGPLASQLAFDETMQTVPGLPNVTMQGAFGSWQLTTGGSGPLINLAIPIQTGNFTTVGSTAVPVELAGGSVKVQVQLGFHPVSDPAASEAGNPSGSSATTRAALKIVTSGSAPAAGSATDIKTAASAPAATGSTTTISVVGVTMPAGANSFVSSSVSMLVQQWIAKNTSFFDYVFLTVDVAETAAEGEWAWIKPTFVGYAYTDFLGSNGVATGIDDAVIAIMSMTEGRTPGKNPNGTIIAVSTTVSESAIPTNAGVNAGLLIQPSLLLEKIIAPNMPALFSGAQATDFEVSDTNLSVANVNALTLQLEMDPTWYPFSKTCTATIPPGDLSVSLNQTNVQQSFSNISFPYGYQDELTVELSLTSTSAIGVDGTGQFTMEYGTDTVSTLSVQPDASKIAAEALESIGVNLVVTALCCLSFGAAGGEVAETVTSGEANAGRLRLTNEIPSAENLTGEQQEVASQIEARAGSESGVSGSVELTNQENAVGSSQLNSELGNVAQVEMRNPRIWTLKGIQPRFTFKVWSMFVGMFAGQIYSNLSNIDIIEAYDQDPTKMPTLQNFLAGCISPATWTNTGDQKLVCAGLNGSFVMGFTVPMPSTSVSA